MLELLSDNAIWLASVLALVSAAWASLRPSFKWAINTDAFLAMVLKLVAEGDLDRAILLTNAAPNAPVARLVRTIIEEGRYAAERQRDTFESMFTPQRLKLGLATMIVVLTSSLAGYLAFLGTWSWPLIGSCVFSMLLLWAGWSGIAGASRGCELILTTWYNELMAATPDELRGKIGGNAW